MEGHRLMADSPVRVMVVDDEEEFRLLLQGILSREGFEVVLEPSGRAAFEKLQRGIIVNGAPPVDLVVTDCRMPGGDGFELLSWIRTSENLQGLPVLMISGALS